MSKQMSEQTIVCDFCFVPAVRWSYPCQSFEITWLGWRSLGGWAACEECHRLIEAEDWTQMLDRCVRMQTLDPEEQAIVTPLLVHTHAQFQANRYGTARPHLQEVLP